MRANVASLYNEQELEKFELVEDGLYMLRNCFETDKGKFTILAKHVYTSINFIEDETMNIKILTQMERPHTNGLFYIFRPILTHEEEFSFTEWDESGFDNGEIIAVREVPEIVIHSLEVHKLAYPNWLQINDAVWSNSLQQKAYIKKISGTPAFPESLQMTITDSVGGRELGSYLIDDGFFKEHFKLLADG